MTSETFILSDIQHSSILQIFNKRTSCTTVFFLGSTSIKTSKVNQACDQ